MISASILPDEQLALYHNQDGTDPVTSLEFALLQPPLRLRDAFAPDIYIQNDSAVDLKFVAPCGDVFDGDDGPRIGRLDLFIYDLDGKGLGWVCHGNMKLASGEMVRGTVNFSDPQVATGDLSFTVVFGAVGEGEEAPARIAFDSDRGGDFEIYVMDDDGSNPINVTNNPAADHVPAWSHDSARIAFHSDRDGNGDVFVIDADGTNPLNLTNHPADDTRPAWCETMIAFDSDRDGNREIYVMDTDGSNLTRLTNDPGDDDDPTLSPDCTWIAFHSNRAGGNDIYRMETTDLDGDGNGDNLAQLTADFASAPDWSP